MKPISLLAGEQAKAHKEMMDNESRFRLINDEQIRQEEAYRRRTKFVTPRANSLPS